MINIAVPVTIKTLNKIKER